jgi:hypothetical protein
MAALKIPDELKAQAPATMWGKILMTSPVVMAVLATMLAGLASSEMTKAQYDRSLAAQQQSKAGDQWSFFQAKRLRSGTQRNTVDLLQATLDIGPLGLEGLRQSASQLPAAVAAMNNQVAEMLNKSPGGEGNAAATAYLAGTEPRAGAAAAVKTELLAALESPEAAKALAAMQRGEVPVPEAGAALDPDLMAALDAMESSKSEAEIAPYVARIDDQALTEALRAAKDRTAAMDEATGPVNRTIDRLSKLIDRQAALLQEGRMVLLAMGATPRMPLSMNREFTAARLAYTAARYDAEARLNQNIANLYELEVRRSNQSAERHHARSQRFFYGMLGAQLAVIISTFAIAAQKRNLLWSLAAGAGLMAAAFGAYVYLYV